MTIPVEIMIGLHYHVWTTEYAADQPGHRNSPVVRRILDDFVARGLLVRLETPTSDGATYERTDALSRWIEELKQVPLPEPVIGTDAVSPRPTGP